MAKTKKHIHRITPYKDSESESESEPDDRPNDEPSFIKVTPEIDREIEVMERLEELNCSCTPRLYDYMIDFQPEPAKIQNGYLMILIMEKVPGRNLNNFDTFSLEERDRVRIAFAKSIM